MVICHALTGSADVEDWWGPLIGPGKAFDTSRFFIFCGNVLGSPYGSVSPCTVNPETGMYYGPEFPLVTIRDSVNTHRMVLDDLDVDRIAVVIGGSMGGMMTLEWAFLGPNYVRSIIPMATSATHSAWCISWGEAQRQSIYADPKYRDGYYSFADPPVTGLAAARMSALLTYRSRNSFESRFGRTTPTDPTKTAAYPDAASEHWSIHNDGHRLRSTTNNSKTPPRSRTASIASITPTKERAPTYFNAQSYLRYQGQKFVQRFDPNCYIAITRSLDTHDVSRGRFTSIQEALESLKQPTLVLGIASDGLFTFAEQEEIAQHVPNAHLEKITSPEGHDGFLLEFDQVNLAVMRFLRETLPEIMERDGAEFKTDVSSDVGTKSSVFGEFEGNDLTSW